LEARGLKTGNRRIAFLGEVLMWWKRKNKEEPDGTIEFRDRDGKMRKTWVPPEQIREWIKQGKARPLYKVLVKGYWRGVKEQKWELSDENVRQFVDKDGTAYAICAYKKGEPHYSLVSKRLWDKFDEVGVILMNPNLTQEQKEAKIKKLIGVK
jgi:hypothetical protein